MKIEKVIFDLGKVLVKFNPRNPFKNIFKSEDDINFFKNICTWEWHINQDIVYDTRPATEKNKGSILNFEKLSVHFMDDFKK